MVVLLLLLASPVAEAGSTGATALADVQGSGSTTAQGDYIASAGGLNTFYSAFIEVPPGLSQLVVQIFDADIGAGGGGEAAANRDRARGGFNTSVNYSLIDPGGTVVSSPTLGPGACGFCDNAWVQFPVQANPQAGHWELRITQSTAVTGGNDINAFGLRAHDGNAGAGGTELNVYFDSFGPYGTNSVTLTRSYAHYPWITSGCLFDHNDFDWDSSSGVTGSSSFSSRTGAFSQSIPALSGNNVWLNTGVGGWTSDAAATDYGIWSLSTAITGYVAGGVDNGNYGQIYLGTPAAPNPPPTGQPLANVFRIYLPTDAGAAPVKPYLEQLLTHVAGPNPPQTGQISRFSVTVRLVNPTPFALAFSAPAELVTANVPGGGAVYAGNAQISQGSLVSQPAVGGTGNVVWNPGTVSAGSTELLAYRVDVTPAAAGQRVPVTGTPAGGGTTARYLDETGNATQARATYGLGPLCELAATEGLATQALLAGFGARAEAGRMVVEWETASEVGTLGFRLLGREPAGGRFQPLHEGLLPALADAPQGGTYRFVDAAVSPGAPRVYRLVEVDRRGRERIFGPFRAEADWSRAEADWRPDLELFEGAYSARRHSLPARQLRRLEAHARARRQARTAALEESRGRWADGIKIAVRRDGLYFVTAEEIGDALGLPGRAIEAWIRRGLLALSLGGREVAWLPAPGGQGLSFYGRAPDSLYSLDNVYRLERGRGLWMEPVDLAPGAPAAGAGSFPERLHLEEDRFAATVLPLDPASDYWFWQAILAGHPGLGTASVDLAGPGATGTGAAFLTVHLQGATDSGIAGEHRARIWLDGVELGEAVWQGMSGESATFAVDPALLADGTARVEIQGLLAPGVPISAFYVDAFDLRYRRSLEAREGRLPLTAGEAGPVTVAGLSGEEIQVLDLRDPDRPRRGTGVQVEAAGASFRATFNAAGPEVPYLVLSPAAVARPEAVWPESRLRSPGRGAEYLVIAPRELLEAAESLALQRRRFRGLETLVVDLEEIYDEYNHGLPSPEAIRAFLRHAWRSWRLGPRFVLLAGDGSYDYRDLLGLGGNLVPPLMVRTEAGLFAADALYGDVEGADGVPEIAVGRLPVLTPEELELYTAKLHAYENAPGPAPDDLLLVSDDPDGEADFGAQSDRLAHRLAARFRTSHLSLETLGLPALRQALFDAIRTGSGLVSYFGHGGSPALADEGILTGDDVPGLGNAEHPMVLTALTCVVNRFELPGFLTLGEALVLAREGGGVAAWAPTGLSQHGEAELLGRGFYDAIRAAAGEGERPVLGEAVQSALGAYARAGADPAMLRVYALLGDPALRLHLREVAPEPPEPPAGGGDGE